MNTKNIKVRLTHCICMNLYLLTLLEKCLVFGTSWIYSQTCVLWPPMGPEKRSRYAEGCKKKISGKKAQGWSLWLHTTKFF